MGTLQEYTPDDTGGEGKKRKNPGMSGDNTDFAQRPVEQVPDPVQGISDVQPAQPKTVTIGLGDTNPTKMMGQDGNELGTKVQIQTTKFNDTGVKGPKSPRPAKL